MEVINMMLGQRMLNGEIIVDKMDAFVLKFLFFVLFFGYNSLLFSGGFSLPQNTVISADKGYFLLVARLPKVFLMVKLFHNNKDYN